MTLGIAEDFTSNVPLDNELTAVPSNGLYLNSGVHPSITTANLLAFLPLLDLVIAPWDSETAYGIYANSRNKSDLVMYDGIIYESISTDNEGSQPDESTEDWLATNIESLRLKSFIQKVKDKVLSDLKLTKRLVNNQYLYEVGRNESQLPNDYCGWVFEPKGSDYISIRLNEVSFQKSGTAPVNLYVINQGVLIDTLTITPANGTVNFKRLDYAFKGKGKWIFAVDSTEVFINGNAVDPLKYDGFVCYTTSGSGASPEAASYNYGSTDNGLGFNVTAFLDSESYIENNLDELGNFVRACFELSALQMYLSNPNNRSNREQLIQMDANTLLFETKDLSADTVVKRYHDEKKRALRTIEKTFDTQLSQGGDFIVDYDSV